MGNQKRKALERKKQQRNKILAYGAIATFVIAAVVVYLTMLRPETKTYAPSPNEAAAFAGGPATLVYAHFEEGGNIHRLDLTTDGDEVSGQQSFGGDTKAAFGSEWMVIERPEDRDDGGFQPIVHLFDPTTEEQTRLGIGFGASFSADGELLAWAEADDPTTCGEDECKGDTSVVITDVSTGEPETLLGPGPYEVIGWAGDYVIIEDSTVSEQPTLHSVSPTGEVADLPVRPVDYWGASPDGRFIIESGESGSSRFFEFEEGRVTGEGEEIGIKEGTKLGAGSWAHDSSAVGAFVLGEEGLEYVTFSPSAPEPKVLDDGGEASTGISLWSPDNDAVVFQRFTGTELEAVHCPTDDPDACEVVLTWTRGIALLRVE